MRKPLPNAVGGAPPYQYTLEQCPLDWLELVDTELAANPRPEHSGERRLCRYRVTDAEGGFEKQVPDFSATPVPINVFQFENRHIVDRDLPVGSAIEEIVLPRAVNGEWRFEYELSPLLPDGLEFVEPTVESGRPRIRGTPTSVSLLTRYCVHATDASGATAAPRCFHLRTVGHEVPRFTANLQAAGEVLLYSEVISTNERPPPELPEVGDTIPMPLRPVWIQMPVAFLPPSWDGEATYSIVSELDPFLFNSGTRRLTSPSHHPLPTPVVYTYGVRREEDQSLFAAAICFELGHRIEIRTPGGAGSSSRCGACSVLPPTMPRRRTASTARSLTASSGAPSAPPCAPTFRSPVLRARAARAAPPGCACATSPATCGRWRATSARGAGRTHQGWCTAMHPAAAAHMARSYSRGSQARRRLTATPDTTGCAVRTAPVGH